MITIREGRNRQVRKMCDAIGHPVEHLKRVAIGPIRDPRLKLGHWRELITDEVKSRSEKQPGLATPASSRHKGHTRDRGRRGSKPR